MYFGNISVCVGGNIYATQLTESHIMITRVFLSHPRQVNESYGEHAVFAGSFALRLFLAGGAALVHAVIPCLFEKTASKMIAQMYARTHNRGH